MIAALASGQSTRAALGPLQARQQHGGHQWAAAGRHSLAPSAPGRRSLAVRASQVDEKVDKKKVEALEESLKKSGLDSQRAQQVLKMWQSAAGSDSQEITADDLRKVLVKQGATFSGLALVQILFDVGAAYGAATAGGFLGDATQQFGLAAVALQAVAYFLSGYYAIGAFFDLFKLGMLLTAVYQFNVNSAAFLVAVKELAGSAPTGLGTVDKAVEAVNTLKVISGLNKMADLLKEESKGQESGTGMLKDLAAYLTLEKAQRLYGFEASQYGISETEAAQIATVFSAFDSDDNGVLSLDEFQRLCAAYAPDLSAAEVKSGLQLLDKNKDGIIQLGEFVEWWLNKVQPPAKEE